MKKNIFKNCMCQRIGILMAALFSTMFVGTSCKDYPVDEDDLLITDRSECYVSSFSLSGVDRKSVTVTVPTVIEEDTPDIEDNGKVRPRIEAEVYFGTDVKNLYPVFNLVTDAKLEPKITGLTDFSDLSNPKKYTVISGNREVHKTYTVYITVQQPNY
jgi:hypothetical protein